MGGQMSLGFVSFPFKGWDLKFYDDYKANLIREVEHIPDEDVVEIYPNLFHGNEVENLAEAKEEIKKMILNAFATFDQRDVASFRIHEYIVFASGGMSYGDTDSTQDLLEGLDILIDYYEGVKGKRLQEWAQ